MYGSSGKVLWTDRNLSLPPLSFRRCYGWPWHSIMASAGHCGWRMQAGTVKQELVRQHQRVNGQDNAQTPKSHRLTNHPGGGCFFCSYLPLLTKEVLKGLMMMMIFRFMNKYETILMKSHYYDFQCLQQVLERTRPQSCLNHQTPDLFFVFFWGFLCQSDDFSDPIEILISLTRKVHWLISCQCQIYIQFL